MVSIPTIMPYHANHIIMLTAHNRVAGHVTVPGRVNICESNIHQIDVVQSPHRVAMRRADLQRHAVVVGERRP